MALAFAGNCFFCAVANKGSMMAVRIIVFNAGIAVGICACFTIVNIRIYEEDKKMGFYGEGG